MYNRTGITNRKLLAKRDYTNVLTYIYWTYGYCNRKLERNTAFILHGMNCSVAIRTERMIGIYEINTNTDS